MLSNRFPELTHLIAGSMYPLANTSPFPTSHSISYIEDYQYKVRKLRMSHTIGLLLSDSETRLDCLYNDEFPSQRFGMTV